MCGLDWFSELVLIWSVTYIEQGSKSAERTVCIVARHYPFFFARKTYFLCQGRIWALAQMFDTSVQSGQAFYGRYSVEECTMVRKEDCLVSSSLRGLDDCWLLMTQSHRSEYGRVSKSQCCGLATASRNGCTSAVVWSHVKRFTLYLGYASWNRGVKVLACPRYTGDVWFSV